MTIENITSVLLNANIKIMKLFVTVAEGFLVAVVFGIFTVPILNNIGILSLIVLPFYLVFYVLTALVTLFVAILRQRKFKKGKLFSSLDYLIVGICGLIISIHLIQNYI